MDNKESQDIFDAYQRMIPSNAPISLLGAEDLDAPIFYHPSVKVKDILCVYGVNNVPSQVLPIINEEGFNDIFYIQFNSMDMPVRYLTSWAKIQIKSDNWFEFIWGFEPNVSLLNLEKTKHLSIYKFIPGNAKDGEYSTLDKSVIHRVKKKIKRESNVSDKPLMDWWDDLFI